MADQPKKLHIAVFPWLAFGHIIPYFELAKLIAQKGHKVSFISTPTNIKRLPKLPSNLQPLVELIELSLPHVENLPQNAEATMDIPQHIVPYLKKAFDGLQQSLAKFLESSTPHCFGLKSNDKPSFDDDPSNKVVLQHYENKTMSEDHDEENESGVSDMFRHYQVLGGVDVVAVRTCMEIEAESIKVLQNQCRKPVIPVGLLPPSLYLFSSEVSKNDEDWNTILKWLDEQEERSVIYVAFGSEVALNDEEFTEITMGLELSGFPFFWVLKKQNSSPDVSSSMETKRGIVWTNWVPQLKILVHKSVGGFLSHSGWSSVIESLQFGCPLIMLPFQNEQGLVARLMEEKMVGIKVPRNEHDGKFTRDSLAKALRSVILEDNKGKIYRNHAEKMSKIFGDKELHQKYIDEFVDYMEIHSPSPKIIAKLY
ncbi:Putative UDP-rhamnose:rhamnosyltransferase [Arachis hypogaea]|nr:Putative UDP-rhamnose:rhamnosyltransferase [Arachis hypogaea]